MDKLEILLDMIEHPERYTEQQITDLLADEEMRKHYDVMVRLRGAYVYSLPHREGEGRVCSSSHCRHLHCRRLPRRSGLGIGSSSPLSPHSRAYRVIRSLPNREGEGRVRPRSLRRHTS